MFFVQKTNEEAHYFDLAKMGRVFIWGGRLLGNIRLLYTFSMRTIHILHMSGIHFQNNKANYCFLEKLTGFNLAETGKV